MAISRYLSSLLAPMGRSVLRAVRPETVSALAVTALVGFVGSSTVVGVDALAQEPPQNFQASPIVKENAFANPGYVQLTWETPLGVSDDLKFYEFVRINLRTREVAAWVVEVNPLGPPTSFCDQVNLDPTLATEPYRTYQFGRYLPPPPPKPDPVYPWPYLGLLGPNWLLSADGDPDLTRPPVELADLLPPGPVFGPPSGPSGAPWTPTLQATAYRYYMRAIYDTNETAPAPRFEGSSWVTSDGWRQVVVDVITPNGPQQTPLNEVTMTDFYVSDVRRPFVPPNPAFEQYSDINVPFGDEDGCPIVGVRLQWKAGPTTSAPSEDVCSEDTEEPWPILGDPGQSPTAPVVDATLEGDNVPPGINTAGLPGGSVALAVEQGSNELSLLTRGAFLRNGDMLDIGDGSALDVALGEVGNNGIYYVSVLENDFFGALGAASKIALSVNQADAENFNRANFLTANADAAGQGILPFLGNAEASADDLITLPPGMYLDQGDEIEVIDSSNPALVRNWFVIRQDGPPATRTTLNPDQIRLASSEADAQALTAQPVAAGTTLTIRTRGAGLPVRYRIERGYVAANATAVDLPPDNVFLIYESPEIANPDWIGLGTFQAIPDPTDWTVSRDVVFDDTFQLPNQNPPVCQFAYWYGVTQFVTLDAEGLYEVASRRATELVDPNTGTPILPIGAYACNNVDLDATGVVGLAADPAECSGATFCIPAGTSTVLGDRIRLTWDVAAQTFYSQFRVYRGVCPEDDPALYELQGPFIVVPGTTNAFSDFATAPNTKYWYRVEGFQPLSGWTQITPPEIGFRLPPPSVTSATDGTLVNRVNGTVTKPTDWDPDSMRLWRRVTSVTPVVWQDLGPITGNAFADTTVQAGFVYAYAASATSAELDAESIRGVVNQGYPAVGPPTGVTATTNLPQYVRLSWVSPVASGAPVSYQVFRRKGTSGRFIQIGTTTSLAYFDVTAVPNTNYQYQVRVRLSNGAVSANSSTVTGRRIVVPSAP
jgi:hypothetical protein